jgi:diguanylate cyclase (GGDEF)-like protein
VNSLLIAVSAALGACVVVLVTLLVVLTRRAERRADTRLEQVVLDFEDRLDALAMDLSEALERAEAEGRRSRFLAEIAGSIDLDEVLARTLESARALPGVDAGLVRIEPRDGERPIVATLGLSQGEAERQAVVGPPERHDARAIEVGYRYPADVDAEELVRAGLAVPLAAEDGRLGYLIVFTRSRDRRFDDDDTSRLEELAERAGPAIENARRFREARRLADLDALTGLRNRRFFHETLAREVARAQRYGRGLALVMVDLDDFKAVNDRVGHLAGDAVLAEAAGRVREVVRSADIACRVGGDEFAVIAPEAGLEEAHELVVRIQRAVSTQPLGKAGRVQVSGGVADLQPQDDAISLFERADERLYAAKHAGKNGLSVA